MLPAPPARPLVPRTPTHDPTFPALHGRPRRGWLNDPNGLCRVDGRYHVFFQHNPDAPVHGAICWGHVSSTDLVTWTEEPLALRPRPGEVDAAGCWSGCVVVDDGVPTAVYTAVREQPGDAFAALARGSADLRHWVQGDGVVAGPDDPAVVEVRDPFLLTVDGHRYAVQGAGAPDPDGRPQLLGYRVDDLERWEPLGPVLTTADPVAAEVAPASIWECPNLFRLGSAWVLLLSLWRADGTGTGTLSGVRYLVGDLRTDDGLRFVPRAGGVLDDGPAFYAPQVLVEPDRVLLWGWAWELGRSAEQVAAAGWAGSLTFPRELALEGDVLTVRPAAELVALRRAELDPAAAVEAAAFEVLGAGPLTLVLSSGTTTTTVLELGAGPHRVLVDGSVVEAYGPAGTLTTRAYPGPGSHWRVTGADAVFRLGLPPTGAGEAEDG